MLETLRIETLKPHPSNEAMWGTLDVTDLIDAIEHSNRITPVLVSRRENCDNILLGGHRRYIAAKTLGWEELDAEVHEGLTEQQELAMIFLDNCANRKLGGDEKLKAALLVMETIEGTRKQKIQQLADVIGTKFESAKKIFDKASKVKKAEDTNPEQAESIKSEALAAAKEHGARSQTIERSIAKFIPEDDKVGKQTGYTVPTSEYQTLQRTLDCIVDSFPEGIWRDMLRCLNQSIDLPTMKQHLAQNPVTLKTKLDISTPDPPTSIYDYFVPFFQGQQVYPEVRVRD